ncbi:MAG: hypothetical protein V3U76_11590 [Granulosicoccus sp.]
MHPFRIQSGLSKPVLPLLAGVLCSCAAVPAPSQLSLSADTGRQNNLQRETDDWSQASAESTPALLAAEKAPLFSVQAVAAPLDSLLLALARDANIELVLQAPLKMLVTLNVLDRSLVQVLDAMAQQAEFQYELSDRSLNIVGPGPYSSTYTVDYLNLDRLTRSRVGLATQVGTINAADAAAGGGIANSSETLIENTAEHRFWYSLKIDLESLLGASLGGGKIRWTINRDAGLLTLYAEHSVHQDLQRYLEKLHDSAQRQVLIEATVIEVALSDRFEAGIDWQLLAKGVNGLSAAQVLTGAPVITAESVSRLPRPSGILSLVQQNRVGDVAATLSLLEQFGDVRILSRPRIIALNNQPAVLKVVDNHVYFTVNVERRLSDTRDEIVTETEIHTVPVGLVMNVTAFVGSDDVVMLNVRPTLSRILGFVDDPNPELALANIRNSVPEIQVREMESMLRVRSGDIAIIGGLMQESVRDTDRQIPGAARLPLVGRLFTQKSRSRTLTELLVVLRPTITPVNAERRRQ